MQTSLFHRLPKALTLSFYAAALQVVVAADFKLEPNATVLIVATPNASQGNAMMLADHLQKLVPGLNCKVSLRASDEPNAQFVIGPAGRAATLIAETPELSKGAVAWDVTPNQIAIVGEDVTMTRIAVTRFLKEACDVDWYMPGDLGLVTPKPGTLTIASGKRVTKPAYISRHYSGLSGKDDNLWSSMVGTRPLYRFHHAMSAIFPPSKFGSDPEMYPFYNGHRQVPQQDGNAANLQMCLTNPKVISAAIEAARTEKYISLSPNDGHGFCECPECIKEYNKEDISGGDNQFFALSRYVFNFVNKVAKGAPDTTIGILAYSNYRGVPPGLKLEPNVVPYVTAGRDPVATPAGLDQFVKDVQAWHDAGARHIGIYEWYHGSGYYVPRNYTKGMAAFLKKAHELGADGLYAELYPNWALDGPKYWLLNELAWNPSLDIDEALKSYCDRMFGKAASPAMQDYFNAVEEVWISQGQNEEGFPALNDPLQFKPFDEKTCIKLKAFLTRASKASAEPEQKARIEYFTTGFDFYSSLARIWHTAQKPKELLAQGKPLQEVLAALQAPVTSLALVNEKGDKLVKTVPFGLNPIGYNSPIYGTAAGASTETTADAIGRITEKVAATIEKNVPYKRQEWEDEASKMLKDLVPSAPDNQAFVGLLENLADKVLVIPSLEPDEKIEVNGGLDDSGWAKAAEASGFRLIGVGRSPRDETSIKVIRSADTLYFGIRCNQEMKATIKRASGRDDRLWLHDSIEVLMNTPSPKNEDNFIQFIVNSAGDIYDSKDGKITWNGIRQSAAKALSDGWEAEVALPLDEAGIPKDKPLQLRMNFIRNSPWERTSWFPAWFANKDFRSRGWVLLNSSEK